MHEQARIGQLLLCDDVSFGRAILLMHIGAIHMMRNSYALEKGIQLLILASPIHLDS
jgi:hypothetical protein